MLIWTNFDSFAITYINISSSLQKLCFPIEVVLNFLQTQKGMELAFRSQFLRFFHKFCSSVIWHNLAKFHSQTVFTSQVIQ